MYTLPCRVKVLLLLSYRVNTGTPVISKSLNITNSRYNRVKLNITTGKFVKYISHLILFYPSILGTEQPMLALFKVLHA